MKYPQLDDLLGRSTSRLLSDLDEAEDRLDVLAGTEPANDRVARVLDREAHELLRYQDRLEVAIYYSFHTTRLAR